MRLTEFNKSYQFEPETLGPVRKHFTVEPNKTDNLQAKSWFGLIPELHELGWDKIGADSSYSDVFAKAGKNYVMKINRSLDEPFAWFAFLTHKKPNVHFPKIGAAKVYTYRDQKYYIYLIEKLEKFVNTPEIPSVVSYAAAVHCIARGRSLQETLRYHSKVTPESYESVLHDKSMMSAITILKDNVGEYGIDIHDENIMRRGDGTLVIIDPYAY